jgi:hypothetical protein
MVVTSVALDGVSAHLRYLVRRLRARLPQTPMVAGIWRQGDAAVASADLQKTVGADVLVTSLRAAVEAATSAAVSAPEPALRT